MEISPYMLTLLLIYSFLFGMAAGVFNDVNRITRALLGDRRRGAKGSGLYDIELFAVGKLSERRRSPVIPIVVFIQDILLFVFIGCGIVVLNFYLNRGQMRLYTISAVAAGFGLYYFTLGKLIMLISDYIVFFIRAAFAISARLVSMPFVALWRAMKKIFVSSLRKIRFLLEKKAVIRYNEKEVKRLLRLSESGFITEKSKEGDADEV